MANTKTYKTDKQKTAQKKRTALHQLKRYLSLIARFPMNRLHRKVWDRLANDYSK